MTSGHEGASGQAGSLSDEGAQGTQATPASKAPRVNLLDLPDELLNRIFNLALSPSHEIRKPRPYGRLCKRIYSVVRPTYGRTLNLPRTFKEVDRILANVARQPQSFRDGIEMLQVQITRDWTRAHFAILSQLRQVRIVGAAMCFEGDEDFLEHRGSISLDKWDSFARMIASMPSLKQLHLSTGMRPQSECEVVGLEHVSISAFDVTAAAMDLCATTRSMKLKYTPTDNTFDDQLLGATLPWSTLRQLEIDIRDAGDASLQRFFAALQTQSKEGLATPLLTHVVVRDQDSGERELRSALLEHVAQCFRHSPLISLDLISDLPLIMEFDYNMFPRWPTLRVLRLDSEERYGRKISDLVELLWAHPGLTHLTLGWRALFFEENEHPRVRATYLRVSEEAYDVHFPALAGLLRVLSKTALLVFTLECGRNGYDSVKWMRRHRDAAFVREGWSRR
ncbi:hypothetical protein JCM10908_006311 [Rhodotorula pacifica]|uniref:uncharacterized protein n=1 Tax=Rhodotorula pacifica TaxID=1495444 RepID=UPI003170D334